MKTEIWLSMLQYNDTEIGISTVLKHGDIFLYDESYLQDGITLIDYTNFFNNVLNGVYSDEELVYIGVL